MYMYVFYKRQSLNPCFRATVDWQVDWLSERISIYTTNVKWSQASLWSDHLRRMLIPGSNEVNCFLFHRFPSSPLSLSVFICSPLDGKNQLSIEWSPVSILILSSCCKMGLHVNFVICYSDKCVFVDCILIAWSKASICIRTVHFVSVTALNMERTRAVHAEGSMWPGIWKYWW